MATRQGLDASIVNRLGADEQSIFLAVEAIFDTDTIRVWSGLDDLTIGGNTYTGAGSLLNIGGVEENTQVQSNGLDISLSGIDSTVLGYAITENYQNRTINLYLGYLMGGTNEVAGTLTLQ